MQHQVLNHYLFTIARSSSLLSSTAKGLFFPSSNEGDANVGSSILKIIFPSFGLVSGGRSSEAVTWQRARVDPIDAIQTPNSLPNAIEIGRYSNIPRLRGQINIIYVS